MNLLMVSPNLPYQSWGAGTRNHYLLKILACRHTVSLLALIDSAEVESYHRTPLLQDFTHTAQLITRPKAYSKRLQQLKCVVRGRSYLLDAYTSVEMQEALDTLVAGNHYDALFFEGALIAGYRIPKDMRVIIDQHNIEYELLQRTYQHERAGLRKWYNLLESRLLKPVEIERCRRADVVLVTSERERLA